MLKAPKISPSLIFIKLDYGYPKSSKIIHTKIIFIILIFRMNNDIILGKMTLIFFYMTGF